VVALRRTGMGLARRRAHRDSHPETLCNQGGGT
jgi:hypothetical protein